MNSDEKLNVVNKKKLEEKSRIKPAARTSELPEAAVQAHSSLHVLSQVTYWIGGHHLRTREIGLLPVCGDPEFSLLFFLLFLAVGAVCGKKQAHRLLDME